jgi:hypothetical protein
MKFFAIAALLGLLAWSNRDQIPLDYQFWKKAEMVITVQNNSDQDIQNVGVVVESIPHPLGTIPKGKSQVLKLRRGSEVTDVVVRFAYRSETFEHHAGTLTDKTGYRMIVGVNFAGVVTSQVVSPGLEGQ